MMIQSMTSVKHDIWSKLAVYFNKYKGEDGEMSTASMEKFIVEVLGEKEPGEREYVMNNFFRVDLDSNGSVSFFELVILGLLRVVSCFRNIASRLVCRGITR